MCGKSLIGCESIAQNRWLSEFFKPTKHDDKLSVRKSNIQTNRRLVQQEKHELKFDETQA